MRLIKLCSGLGEILDAEEERVHFMPQQLSRWFKLNLLETQTIWLFAMDGTLVSQHSEEGETMLIRNAEYEMCCRVNASSDSTQSGLHVQTMDPTFSTEYVQTDSILKKEIGCIANMWDLYDKMNFQQKQAGPDDVLKTDIIEQNNTDLLQHLHLMECLISLNLYQSELKQYRQQTTSQHENSEAVSSLLWSINSTVNHSKGVFCIEWNPIDQDLLCVGYGGFSNMKLTSGAICCWSLKNLLNPRLTFYCPSGVSSICFSKEKPKILACGLLDGSIRIYDISQNKGKLIVDSRDSNLHHNGPIWTVKFASIQVQEKLITEKIITIETLISTSEDGCVKQWTNSKPLKQRNIFHIKTTKSKDNYMIGIKDRLMKNLSNYEPFSDFQLNDDNMLKDPIYLVASGFGFVHQCSMLCKDESLQTYTAHDGPAYRVRYSPFCKDTFLTCGCDWKIKLWRKDSSKCLLSLQSGMSPVYDITWSPHSPTVFASATPNRLDVWDLNKSILEPVITVKSPRKEIFTSVLFSHVSTSIFVGCNSGKVNVYHLANLQSKVSNKQCKLTEIVNKAREHE